MRDRANINTGLWTDQDWRDVPKGPKYLYMMLMSHPTLSYAGVADWRPGRLAAMSPDDTAEQLRADAETLRDMRFVFFDDETEEILVRSFLRHDGILKQPKLSISMVNAFGSIASKPIRQIVVHELQRLAKEYPEWAAFRQEKVQALTKLEGKDMREFTQAVTPAVTPELTQGFTLNGDRADPLHTATATATSTPTNVGGSGGNAKSKRATQLPDNFTATPEMKAWAKTNTPGIDIEFQTEQFKDHHAAKGSTFKDWRRAWQTWMRKAQSWQKPETQDIPHVWR